MKKEKILVGLVGLAAGALGAFAAKKCSGGLSNLVHKIDFGKKKITDVEFVEIPVEEQVMSDGNSIDSTDIVNIVE